MSGYAVRQPPDAKTFAVAVTSANAVVVHVNAEAVCWREFDPALEPKLAERLHTFMVWSTREGDEPLSALLAGKVVQLALAPGSYYLLVERASDGARVTARKAAPGTRSCDIAGPLVIAPFSGSSDVFSICTATAVLVEASHARVRWHELAPDYQGYAPFLHESLPGPHTRLGQTAELAKLALPPGLYKVSVSRHVDEHTSIRARRFANAPGQQLPVAATPLPLLAPLTPERLAEWTRLVRCRLRLELRAGAPRCWPCLEMWAHLLTRAAGGGSFV